MPRDRDVTAFPRACRRLRGRLARPCGRIPSRSHLFLRGACRQAPAPHLVLDVGCGTGSLPRLLKRRRPGRGGAGRRGRPPHLLFGWPCGRSLTPGPVSTPPRRSTCPGRTAPPTWWSAPRPSITGPTKRLSCWTPDWRWPWAAAWSGSTSSRRCNGRSSSGAAGGRPARGRRAMRLLTRAGFQSLEWHVRMPS